MSTWYLDSELSTCFRFTLSGTKKASYIVFMIGLLKGNLCLKYVNKTMLQN